MVSTTDCADRSKPIAEKKVSKPIMEKKRRARINKSLDQLKALLESYYSSNIRKRKLEKADILELTVKHLRNLQKIQSCSAASSEFSDYHFGFRGCLANVNQYLKIADNLTGSDRCMLSQLSSKLCRSVERGEVFSTTDSGPGQAETQDEARGVLPSAAGPEETSTAKSKALKGHSARRSRYLRSEAQQASGSKGTKEPLFAAASAQKEEEKSSPCRKFHAAGQRNEVANIQHNVWRPW